MLLTTASFGTKVPRIRTQEHGGTRESQTGLVCAARICVAHDKDGRYIPTRQGNRSFGWVHFSGPHNIHSEKVIKAAVNEHPERGSTKTRKVYGAVLYDTLGIILAKVKVIAQYHWETSDHKYKLADTDDKIGVITAFCQGVNKCPDALNRV
jgi:hypothetical protein